MTDGVPRRRPPRRHPAENARLVVAGGALALTGALIAAMALGAAPAAERTPVAAAPAPAFSPALGLPAPRATTPLPVAHSRGS